MKAATTNAVKFEASGTATCKARRLNLPVVGDRIWPNGRGRTQSFGGAQELWLAGHHLGIDYDGSKIGDGITAKDGMEQPVYYWKPSIGTSGLAFYNGDLFKGWKGNLLAGGLAGQRLERLVLDGDKVVAVEHLLVDRKERTSRFFAAFLRVLLRPS